MYSGCRCSLCAIGWRGQAGRNAMADAPEREETRRRVPLAALARRAKRTAHAGRWQARSPLFYSDCRAEGAYLNPKFDAMYTLVPGMIARGGPIEGVGQRSAMQIHFTEPYVTPPPARAQRYPDSEFQSIYSARMPDVEEFST